MADKVGKMYSFMVAFFLLFVLTLLENIIYFTPKQRTNDK